MPGRFLERTTLVALLAIALLAGIVGGLALHSLLVFATITEIAGLALVAALGQRRSRHLHEALKALGKANAEEPAAREPVTTPAPNPDIESVLARIDVLERQYAEDVAALSAQLAGTQRALLDAYRAYGPQQRGADDRAGA